MLSDGLLGLAATPDKADDAARAACRSGPIKWCIGKRRARRCNTPVEAWIRPVSRDSRPPHHEQLRCLGCLRSVRNGQARSETSRPLPGPTPKPTNPTTAAKPTAIRFIRPVIAASFLLSASFPPGTRCRQPQGAPFQMRHRAASEALPAPFEPLTLGEEWGEYDRAGLPVPLRWLPQFPYLSVGTNANSPRPMTSLSKAGWRRMSSWRVAWLRMSSRARASSIVTSKQVAGRMLPPSPPIWSYVRSLPRSRASASRGAGTPRRWTDRRDSHPYPCSRSRTAAAHTP